VLCRRRIIPVWLRVRLFPAASPGGERLCHLRCASKILMFLPFFFLCYLHSLVTVFSNPSKHPLIFSLPQRSEWEQQFEWVNYKQTVGLAVCFRFWTVGRRRWMDRRTKCPDSASPGGVFVHGSQLQTSENAYDFCARTCLAVRVVFVVPHADKHPVMAGRFWCGMEPWFPSTRNLVLEAINESNTMGLYNAKFWQAVFPSYNFSEFF